MPIDQTELSTVFVLESLTKIQIIRGWIYIEDYDKEIVRRPRRDTPVALITKQGNRRERESVREGEREKEEEGNVYIARFLG